MSQRASGYERKPLDRYETPPWVTEALLPHLPTLIEEIWEPACGSGKMSGVLGAVAARVIATDIELGSDFLVDRRWYEPDWIITNPPYELAVEFIDRALDLADNVAMLLRTDFDHAKSRRRLFADCPFFEKKVVLTKRIQWFEGTKGSPSFNHAWFIWRRSNGGRPPTLAYGPNY